MHKINEIPKLAPVVSSLPRACRSVLEKNDSLLESHFRVDEEPRTSVCKNETFSSADYLTAGSIYTSRNKLVALAQSQQPRVRGRVAENPSCPIFLLARLVYDLNPEVRLSVASNPKAPAIFLELLSEDDCPDVLLGLAEDPNLADALLEKLSRNENPYVSHRAKQTLKRLAHA
jgi:hypothetical protein